MNIDSQGLAWDAPNLQGADTLELRSADFDRDGTLPIAHAANQAGGQNLSPALTWTPTAGAAQLLLVIEDPDAPTRKPFLHCLALLDASSPGLERGDLTAPVAAGVQFAVSAVGEGYFGPAPPKTHGPHRYVFQLFALRTRLDIEPGPDPRSSAERHADVLARGRLDGFYQRR